MAARVTDSEVRAIMSDLDPNFDTSAFITVADLMVTEELESEGLSADRLKEITRWLSAHFITIDAEKGGVSASEVGDTKETYAVEKAKGLNSTRYGQQVATLDPTGNLVTASKPSAIFQVI